MTDLSGRPTFAETFSDALAASGTTAKQIHDRLADRGLRVSTATLSYWRTGRSVPARAGSHDIVSAMESILGLAPAALLNALASDAHELWMPAEVIPAPLSIRALEDRGLDLNRHAVVEAHTVTATLQHGNALTITDRLIVRSETDYSPTLVLLPTHPVGTVHHSPTLTFPAGDVTGRLSCLVNGNAATPAYWALVLTVDTPLAHGQIRELEYTTTWMLEGPATGLFCPVPALARYLTMDVTFPGVTPVSAETRVVPAATFLSPGTTVTKVATSTVQMTSDDVMPGQYWLTWMTH